MVRLIGLRRSVALWICPELAGRSAEGFGKFEKDGFGFEALNPDVQQAGPVIVRGAKGLGQCDQAMRDYLGAFAVTGEKNGRGNGPEFAQQADGVRECVSLVHGDSFPAVGELKPNIDSYTHTHLNLCLLIKALAEFTNRSPFTVSRLATGSGDTIRRLEATKPNGTPAHRISTERAHRAMLYLSGVWPADLEWPRSIPRPEKSKKEAA